MAAKSPCTKYRPTRTDDLSGGFTEALGTGTTVYLALIYPDNKVKALVARDEDVIVGDIIICEDGTAYRVTARRSAGGWRDAELDLECTERPVHA
jgi:hypothetical protein